ncbi:MAG TPA: hypothetical protein VN081_03390 [Dongiaceae bacterium]|nr:hypothetical protein [Dongiaceae bacterium]
MIQVPYPTGERNFVVSPLELNFPSSTEPERKNNHHLYWTYKRMGEFLITRTFRDLIHNQLEMPVDTHSALHQRYSPPEKLPSLADMIEQIEMAHLTEEPMKVQDNRHGPYFYQQISHIALKQIHMEYGRLVA